jgi:integrase/recombinase XerC
MVHVPSMLDVVLSADCRGQLAAILPTLAGTGIRASELAGLEVEDIDFLRAVLAIKGQVLLDRETKVNSYESTKSPDGMREIPLPAFAVEALAAWLAKRPVFTAERGTGPVTQNSISSGVSNRSRRLGIGAFAPHTLRHRYTTVLHDASVPARAIDYVTGHAPVGVSLAVYTEVTPEALAKVAPAIQLAGDAAVRDAMTHFSRTSGTGVRL